MENIFSLTNNYAKIKTAIIDFILIAFIFFVPAISHLLSFPLYLIEPMRIVLIISMAHTTKRNSFLIAITLPIFSFITASHPSLVKSMLIAIELGINVWLFSLLYQRKFNLLFSSFVSIIVSKLIYYSLKFFAISALLIKSELISTPIYLQVILAIIFSIYMHLVLNKKIK